MSDGKTTTERTTGTTRRAWVAYETLLDTIYGELHNNPLGETTFTIRQGLGAFRLTLAEALGDCDRALAAALHANERGAGEHTRALMALLHANAERDEAFKARDAALKARDEARTTLLADHERAISERNQAWTELARAKGDLDEAVVDLAAAVCQRNEARAERDNYIAACQEARAALRAVDDCLRMAGAGEFTDATRPYVLGRLIGAGGAA